MHLSRAAAALAAALPLSLPLSLPPCPADARSSWRYDFVAPGVVIWSEPRAGSVQRGVGGLGEQFAADRSERHGPFTCGRFEATLWYHGHHLGTGVSGWVPACYLESPD
ncbi:hypothetical protein HII36_45940 [Nonomuraea sp. NN258]|uniref:hypothetical protein n=1 Tax=Nonomuraea antri TaxID=2730852 RepID=UPI001568F225|nr:hypothetical protein [Nonomuraea antri]NRQ39117.1 hypothetical protein [Nonomuraea antri]